MTAVDVSDVTVDGGDYFIQYGSEYMMQQFQYRHINNTDNIQITWRGRSTCPPTTAPMLLQIYNQGTPLATADSYSETNQDSSFAFDSTKTQAGQGITGDGGTLSSAKVYLKKVGGTLSGRNMRVAIYSHTGTFGTSGSPSTLLATSDAIDASVLTASFALIEFTFSGANKITLTNGTNYFLVYNAVADFLNGESIGLDASSPTHGGNYWDDFNGVINTQDLCFYVYTQTTAPGWETLDTENRQPADTDFEMKATVSTNLSNYYDSNNQVTARVYQQVI